MIYELMRMSDNCFYWWGWVIINKTKWLLLSSIRMVRMDNYQLKQKD